MAKEKIITFDDVLTKMSHIFKKDMYMVGHKYFIGGDKTNDDLSGQTLVTIEGIDAVKEFYPEEDVIYLEDIKKYKAGEKDLLKIPSKKEAEAIKEEIKEIEKTIGIGKNWETFDIPEKYHIKFFDDSEFIDIFEWDDDISTLRASKVIFPMITRKNISTWSYSYNKTSDNFNTLLLSCLSDYALINSIIRYFDLKD